MPEHRSSRLRHGDKPSLGLEVANQFELGFRRGLREKIVDAGLSRNRSRRLRVVPVIITVLIPI
jgi:hypothetical protein